ncbi:MAG: ABC transporter ATP-binding protein [Patescibacteria group bacterium]|jgi:putative ABC transport system ATP-binding protein
MNPVLETKNVTKKYKLGDEEIIALEDVSIKIDRGEFVAIVGKSGSGKSTLMHIMGLLDTPTSGEVLLNGTDVVDFSEKQLAQVRNKEIGFVFQSFNLLRRASALDNVILPLRYSSVPKSAWKQKALDMLNTVELGNRLSNKSNELSGGQRQRVAIARALVNDPSIVLADEPTGNLDTKTGSEIIQIFKNLHENGRTIVLVTHDEELAGVADRKIFIRDGKVQ